MSKFNKANVKAAGPKGFIVTDNRATTKTHGDVLAYTRDTKSELFLLAVSNMGGENTFYESGNARDARFNSLIHTVAVQDPAWMAGFLGWLRTDANMRTASLTGGLEAAKAMLQAGIPGGRQILDSVLQRADEPGEALAYWHSVYGRKLPKPVKRGIADAASRLYTEYSVLKYDTASKGYRFADVLELTHPEAKQLNQGNLFKHIIDRRHDRPAEMAFGLPMITMNMVFRKTAAEGELSWMLDAENLKKAGMTWEDALSLAGSKVDKAKLWEALIPTMGYMALLRNLRNFDEAGISKDATAAVATRLCDPGQVARSRQFPYRFLSAYEQLSSVRYSQALDEALALSLNNIPELPGKTLILVDTSASMTQVGMSAKSKMTPAKAAAVFGVALAIRNPGAELWGFANGQFQHNVPKGASLIDQVKKFSDRTGEVGHGTEMHAAVKRTFKGHDRVFMISDMQSTYGNPAAAIPMSVPYYGFNLQGYKATPVATGSNRYEFGGLTDATFRMVPLLERGYDAAWPWLQG